MGRPGRPPGNNDPGQPRRASAARRAYVEVEQASVEVRIVDGEQRVVVGHLAQAGVGELDQTNQLGVIFIFAGRWVGWTGAVRQFERLGGNVEIIVPSRPVTTIR